MNETVHFTERLGCRLPELIEASRFTVCQHRLAWSGLQAGDQAISVLRHTDNVGGVDYNQRLSQHRADAVRHYLVQRGIDLQQLSASGLGMDRPVANNDTPTGRQQNRRVEIIVENPS